MKFTPIKTRPLLPPKDDLYAVLDESLPLLKNGDVLFITSKVLAIHQGRCVKIGRGASKDELIAKEAERLIPRRKVPRALVVLTLKHYTLIPSAGIDESNGKGYYVLWPLRIQGELKRLRRYLMRKYRLARLAVVLTDSHTIPLRYGVVGISVGFVGMEPLINYRGRPDIFGRKLKFTKSNVVDTLAATAVLLMGEGNERQPLCLLRGASFTKFTNRDAYRSLVIPPEKDIYKPLLDAFEKKTR